jgi:MFS-type transporter involved in bile tolerance (Atg22 family)
MDAKDVLLSLIMVASAFSLAYSYLAEYQRSNPMILASTVLLVASLAVMLLSTSARLTRVEQDLERHQRATRMGLQGVEEQIENANSKYMVAVEDISKRIYR